ncbi:MAG: recombinase family protein [Lachnospiraceae bacterium]|nr:recombinase family protein [Lachnospiraceae bacterium]
MERGNGSLYIKRCCLFFSGTNFARPEFNRMIKEIMYGNVECVIVKDFSRFGRNYIESGNYLERIFPQCQVRFISINDHFDSDAFKGKTGGINMAFKNFMNSMYSKDISQKVTMAMKTRAEAGQFMAPFLPYGYRKNPDDIHQLIIDEESAEVVRTIFKLAADGTGKNAIARYLNEEGIETPIVYMNAIGIRKRPVRDKDKKLWTQTTIGDMLKNEQYLGKVIWNKSRRTEVGLHKQTKLPRSEWTIFENAHEPIVSQELFDKANAKAFTGEKKPPCKEKRPGLLLCGSCGRRMSLTGACKSYRCTQAAITGLEGCQCVKRNRYILEDEVLTTAKEWAEEKLVLLNKNKSKWKHEARDWKGRDMLKEKADKLSEKKLRLYDQYKNGKIEKDEYLEQVKIVSDKLEAIRIQLEEIHNKAASAEYNLSVSVELEEKLTQVKELEEYDTRVLKNILDEVIIKTDGTQEYHWNKLP